MSIRADVQQYFEKHPNEKIYLNDLTQELELTSKQLQPAIYYLTKAGVEIEVVIAGQCWIYKPNGNGDLAITLVGKTPKGSLILAIGPNEEMWIARKFEE